ncbi:MAG TPA: HAD-IA family hydrolase [Caulobacterales bacterium]|nr:HAD-IA family hydrolase [Caulobacterales bacterium]
MKLAVWDVDGTIIDSRASIAESMAAAFVANGMPAPSYDQTRAVVGMSLSPAIRALAPDADDDLIASLQAAYVGDFKHKRASGYRDPMYYGADALLRRLKTDGWQLAVATGKSRAGVVSIFDAHDLHDLFDAVHTADDGPGKPDPHMLLENIRVLGANAAQTIMIGDTSHDMAMARAAGVYAQGVTWGFHTAQEMRAGGAHHVAEDFAALEAALDAFGARL